MFNCLTIVANFVEGFGIAQFGPYRKAPDHDESWPPNKSEAVKLQCRTRARSYPLDELLSPSRFYTHGLLYVLCGTVFVSTGYHADPTRNKDCGGQ